MKVAFDENVPAAMVRVFRSFHKERSLKHIVQGVVLESAIDYTPKLTDPDYKPNSGELARKHFDNVFTYYPARDQTEKLPFKRNLPNLGER